MVKNEKRQSVDNRPYGHTQYVIGKSLYPEDHPYNWQVIGSLEDLGRAELQDVKDFYENWYGPNNATLVIAGDFDREQTKVWVENYFGEFEARGTIAKQEKRPGVLAETKRLYHEDNFARVPALTLVWPSVEEYHPDSYALNMLVELLASGKKSPMYRVLVEDKKLTSDVSMFYWPSEIAGQVQLSVRAFPEVSMDDVVGAMEEALELFEEEGIKEADLKRIKAGQETDFYAGLSSVLGKAFQLAHYNIFANDPGFATKEIQSILDVQAEDVMRVYDTYIKGKAYIATSFVPKGQKDLILSGSIQADVVEESIVQNAESDFDVTANEMGYPRTPSVIDRSVEPPFGERPDIVIPEVWNASLANGIDAYGIESTETPLIQFTLRIKGGLLLEEPELTGVSNILAQMLMAGTANKTAAELEEAIDQIGASISVSATTQSIVIRGSSLSRHFNAAMDLVEEILLEPRWDAEEFDIIKRRTLNQLRQQQANPPSIASDVYNKLLYGDQHIMANNRLGTLESVENIRMGDLKTYYEENLSPEHTDVHIAGFVTQDEVMESLQGLNENWPANGLIMPEFQEPESAEPSRVYFVDVPGAKQSVLRIGYLGMSELDADYLRANAMNFKLGGGGFASELMQVLREEKGYTYGAGSRFSGSQFPGPFSISSNVRSNVTLESLLLIKEIIETYPSDYSSSYLEDTKGFLIKSNARRFETLGAKLGILEKISAYGWETDYIKQQEQIIEGLTVEEMKTLATEYIDLSKMIFLVVGDAESQMARLEALGLGAPVLIEND